MKFSAIAVSFVAAASSTSAFVVLTARKDSSAMFSSEMKESSAPAVTTTTISEDIPDMKEFEEKVAASTAVELSTAAAAAAPKEDEAKKEEVVAVASAIDKSKIQPGRYEGSDQSIALPFLKRPPKLDGTHAGDFGFDPLGFTEAFDLYTMQEAEIRHARLAMLAVIGWPMSELLAPKWLLQPNGCAPSVLNGFNIPSFFAVVAAFGAFGYFEYKTSLRRNDDTTLGKLHREDMQDVWNLGVAGDYDFDPLNLYSSIGNDAYARKGLREVEISHGRSAMLGITAFAAWEALTGHAIVDSGSMFFHPNLLLPALFAAYQGFFYFYEIEDDDTFLRFKMSSEGSARWENLQMGLKGGKSPKGEGDGPDLEEIIEKMKGIPEKASNLAENAKEAYANIEKMYMDNVVKKN